MTSFSKFTVHTTLIVIYMNIVAEKHVFPSNSDETGDRVYMNLGHVGSGTLRTVAILKLLNSSFM